jgi:rSAM/selenodomain-associated transferase 1
MTKAPRAGQVKTRLTPPLTLEEAAALNTCFLRDMTTAISITVAEGGTRGIALYTPARAKSVYAGILPPGFHLVPQRGEALGERLIFALEDLFRLGFESACLINSDSPTVSPRTFAEAATILAQPEEIVVLGPTHDGGYYLIGLKRLRRALFEDISWSTERVLEQTIERAQQMNMKVHLLPTWYDVDERVTLQRLCAEIFDPAGITPVGYPAPATRSYLEGLLKREGRDRIWPNQSRASFNRVKVASE